MVTGQITTTIQLIDNVTSVLSGINQSIDTTISAFEKMDGSTGASFSEARASIAQTKSQLTSLTEGLGRNNEPLKHQNALWTKMKTSIMGAVGAYAGFQGLKSMIGLSDSITQTTARLDMMNDGQQTTAELSDKIFESANRSRGAYLDTADAVSKLGTMAGDAFNSSDEIIAFTEQLNKQFTIAGTSVEGQQSAMLQLTQAMGSGVLRGEELNSVLEQAPNIVQSIADYMGKPRGEIKELAADGQITAEIVKNAMLSSADETNKKFESMPKTFGQTWIEIKNSAVKEFDAISTQLSDALNGDQVQKLVRSVISALPGMIQAVSKALSFAMKVGEFIADHWSVIGPIVKGAAAAFLTFKTVSTITGTIKKVTDGIEKLKIVASSLGGLKGIFKIFNINPVFIAIAALAGIVTAIVLLWKNCEGFRNAVKKIWGAVSGVFITAGKAISGFFTKTLPGAVKSVIGFFKSIPTFFVNIGTRIKDAFVGAWKAVLSNPVVSSIVSMIKNVFTGLATALSGIWNGIKMIAAGVWHIIKTVILGPVLIIYDLVTGKFSALKEDVKLIWDGIKSAALAIWTGIKTVITSVVRGAGRVVKSVFRGLSGAVKAIFTGIKTSATSIWTGIKNKVKGLASSLKESVINVFRKMVEGIKNASSRIKEGVAGGISKAICWVKSKISNFTQLGRDIMNGLKNGVTHAAEKVKDTIKGIVDNIKDILTFNLEIGSPSKWTKRIGGWLMEGLDLGINYQTPDVLKRVGNTTDLVKTALLEVNPGEALSTSPAQANGVMAATGSIYSNSRKQVNDNRRFYFYNTVKEEADEDRLIDKLVKVLEMDVYSGGKGVFE